MAGYLRTARFMRSRYRRMMLLAVILFTGLPGSVTLAGEGGNWALDLLKQQFQRPESVPFPAENPYSKAKAELGKTLFFDPQLSRSGKMSCATCHVPDLGWEDGRPLALGDSGQTLARHTPTLWNLAWGEFFFWDGRADTLEAQAAVPIQSHVEMNLPLEKLVQRLKADADYRRRFAEAFPDDPVVDATNMVNALATYERTLVSPETRFDRWVEGDEEALTEQEKHGFLLFTGKANCIACHSGWSFTDHAFHDIGLPGDDKGRGKVLELQAAMHAFKTPTLRDIGRRAPYMHNGSLPTLEAVVAHYESGFIERDTLSADMHSFSLTDKERRDLVAFLHTLDSEGQTDITPTIEPRTETGVTEDTVRTQTVSQREMQFHPSHIVITPGTTVDILNDDKRTHNIRIHDPDLNYNSGAQEPDETIHITFEKSGRYYAFCGIHPKMRLIVDVEAGHIDQLSDRND